jgi:hypothetical protein
MKDPLKSNFKDHFGEKKDNFKHSTESLVKGAVTLAIALPLIGVVAGAFGGHH